MTPNFDNFTPAQKQELLQTISQDFLVGCRIPKDYFITKGTGESDITVHAGSYHLALKNARIEMCNIMTYSSILPGVANEIERPEKLVHGSVLESIMAVANSTSGERATAGITLGWLFDRESGDKYGGLVCEYNGSLDQEEARAQLGESLQELYTNGYSDDYNLRDIKIVSESLIPRKAYGTALVSLCFTNYLYPFVRNI